MISLTNFHDINRFFCLYKTNFTVNHNINHLMFNFDMNIFITEFTFINIFRIGKKKKGKKNSFVIKKWWKYSCHTKDLYKKVNTKRKNPQSHTCLSNYLRAGLLLLHQFRCLQVFLNVGALKNLKSWLILSKWHFKLLKLIDLTLCSWHYLVVKSSYYIAIYKV